MGQKAMALKMQPGLGMKQKFHHREDENEVTCSAIARSTTAVIASGFSPQCFN